MSELSNKLKKGVKHPQQITDLIKENEMLYNALWDLLSGDIDPCSEGYVEITVEQDIVNYAEYVIKQFTE